MMSHDYAHNGNSRPTTLSGNFTADEVARLSNLRRSFHSHADYLRRVLDDRRLEFARWLLENGKLDDQCQDCQE
jgi:hypothetical protein